MIDFTKTLQFYDKTFEKLNLSEKDFHQATFENCKLIKCDISNANLTNCQFVDCEFLQCNLSMAKINDCLFNNVIFEESKCIGLNWSYAHWPQVKLLSPIQFYHCDISLSSFFGLSLKEITVENCKAHEVDFREADFSDANLSFTDFLGSQFIRTKLISADFTESTNYNIDIELNEIKKAKFSFPEVTSLLKSLDIQIVNLPQD